MNASSSSSRSLVFYTSSPQSALTPPASSLSALSALQRTAQSSSRDTAMPRGPTPQLHAFRLHIPHTHNKVPREHSFHYSSPALLCALRSLGKHWSCRCELFWARTGLCTGRRSGPSIHRQRICRRQSPAWPAGSCKGRVPAVRRRRSARAGTPSGRRAEASWGSST